mmetsp:Transcript_15830/g.28975  ORF Transcript_15830/g.28975 Transcript_15830/m.28975 type:complete len:189 (-) Transcript_15830:48-614(-)
MGTLTAPGWCFRKGVVDLALGSAYVEAEGIKVLAQVKSLQDQEEANSHSKGRVKLSSPAKEFIATALESAILLENYPKALIETEAHIIEGPEWLAVPYLIIAFSIALMDAGIELRDTLTGVSVCKVGGQWAVNSSMAKGLTIAYLPTLDLVVGLKAEELGDFTELEEGLELARKAGGVVHAQIRQNYE